MANMSYCRFENTLRDLEDCENALGNIYDEVGEMSDSERNSMLSLVKLCKTISDDWDEETVEDIINDAIAEEDE